MVRVTLRTAMFPSALALLAGACGGGGGGGGTVDAGGGTDVDASTGNDPDAAPAATPEDLLEGSNSTEADPALDETWMPGDGSPALGIGDGPSGAFFDATDYAGAFDGASDWADGWLFDPNVDPSVGVSGCPDHPNVEDTGSVCAISGGDNAPVTEDLTLTAGNDYLLDGPVFIGDDTDETVLTVEPGVVVFGGQGSFLLIQRGSKIMAEGTAENPIVFTSAQEGDARGASDWGGLVINGLAPINNGDGSGEADGEAGSGTYGGDDPEDNSGVLRYVRVEFAGNKVDAENELNGIAFQGVGSGTEVDYVQTHMTSDDGIEFFGGTVSVKHLVITAADDDSMDWTGGWTGNAQFVVIEQDAASGDGGDRGIEADNLEANNGAEPFSDPTLANFTIIGRDANDSEAILLRRGTKGQLHNFIVTGFGGPCLNVDNAQTLENVADGSLSITNHVHDCGGGQTP